MKNINLSTVGWRDYELLDSGDNRKLERYGSYVVIRPETQAIWKPAHAGKWQQANAEFLWHDGKGSWTKNSIPENWELSWNKARFTMRLTAFKHTGIFPEQVTNWEWLQERLAKLKDANVPSAGSGQVLNLFGYTGIASIVAAQAGARVTHVDASKQSNTWAKENAALSGIPEGAIRYILDDTLKFIEREVRRGSVYEGIILDPPPFGRGPNNEVWRIEEDILPLLDALQKILSPKPGAFFLLNGYAAGYSPQSFLQSVESIFTKPKGEFGELRIQESGTDRCIPAGIYVRFVR